MSDVRASQQIGGLVVLPLVLVFVGSGVGLFALGPLLILTFAATLAVADAAILFLAIRVFDREEILVRWK